MLLPLGLLEVWPIARACSRERRLSEYARAGAREELLRGIEKIRKVVKPSASPRVGANLEAILNDSVVDVHWYESICRCDFQTVMIDGFRRCWRGRSCPIVQSGTLLYSWRYCTSSDSKRHVGLVDETRCMYFRINMIKTSLKAILEIFDRVITMLQLCVVFL